MFAIVESRPVHCPFRDSLLGTRSVDTGRRYILAALAHKIAGRMERENYENCGDSTFYVIDTLNGARHRSVPCRLSYPEF